MTQTTSDELTYDGQRSGWQLLDLRELWRFRELIWAFGFRDLVVRYRQTAVGLAWAVMPHGNSSWARLPYVPPP